MSQYHLWSTESVDCVVEVIKSISFVISKLFYGNTTHFLLKLRLDLLVILVDTTTLYGVFDDYLLEIC